MRHLVKRLRRMVTVKAGSPEFEDAVWVLDMDPVSLSVRRLGASKGSAKRISWRGIIGMALVHAK